MKPPHQPVADAIHSLQRLSELFCERREQLAREAGLTVQQWCVLEKISEQHFMPSMFAKTRESSAAAVSKVIRQLLDKGVITVSVQEHDGRQRRYTVTSAGEQIVERLRASRQRAIDVVWSDFDAAELSHFTSFAQKLGSSLESYIKQQRDANGAGDDAAAGELSVCAAVSSLPAAAIAPPRSSSMVTISSTNKFID